MSLIDHLRAANATVVPTGTMKQPFFSVTGQVIMVNGEQVQVYEYANADGANTDSARISPDGGTIGNSMVDCSAPFLQEGPAYRAVCRHEHICYGRFEEDTRSTICR